MQKLKDMGQAQYPPPADMLTFQSATGTNEAKMKPEWNGGFFYVFYWPIQIYGLEKSDFIERTLLNSN